jgi:hypothetical protein
LSLYPAGRLKECWDVAYALNSAETWQRLATAAMEWENHYRR